MSKGKKQKIKKKEKKRYEHLHNYYEKTVELIKEKARTGYKVLCEYFNGSTTRTGLCVVSEDRAIEVLGLKLTERQNGMGVI